MTYYHASAVGSNLKRLVVHPTLVENHIVVYAAPERAVEAFGEYWLFSSVDVRRVLPVTYK